MHTYSRIVVLLGLLITLSGQSWAASADAASQPVKVRRAYVDMRYGQLHYLIATPDLPAAQRKRPLILFHQSPLSAEEMAALAAEMGTDRVTIAVDTPGQGNSDGPAQVPTIMDYAVVINEALHHLGYDAKHPVDLLGSHTGAFIATELAILEPVMVKRVILSGVYIVPEERRLKAVANLKHAANSAEFYNELCHIMPVIQKYYTEQGLDDAAWGRAIASSLLPLTRREYAHEAAFAYAKTAATRLTRLEQPVLLIALNDGIGGPTRDSAAFIKRAQVKDFPDFKDGAWTMHARELAAVVRAFFN